MARLFSQTLKIQIALSTANYLALKAEVESLTKHSATTDIVGELKGLYENVPERPSLLKALLGVLIV